MKVFVSWSKPTSQRLALALRDWLPEVIQQIDPWVSSEDISKGQRWGVEVGSNLEGTSQGILCVTADNAREPWLNFEAGALAKSFSGSRVRPVLLGIQPAEVTGPIAQFQATVATDREDMLRLVHSLNASCDPPLEDDRLTRAFNRSWEELERRLHEILDSGEPESARTKRASDDLLSEILERVREIQRGHEWPEEYNYKISSKNRPQMLLDRTGKPMLPGAWVEHPSLGLLQVLSVASSVKRTGVTYRVYLREFESGRTLVSHGGPEDFAEIRTVQAVLKDEPEAASEIEP